jgi:hypothetical protein
LPSASSSLKPSSIAALATFDLGRPQ